MKTKENTLTVPFVIALYELLFFTGSMRKRIVNLIPICLTLFIIPFTQFFSMGRGLGQMAGEYDMVGYNWFHYVFTQFRVLITYIRLLFLPINQTLEYDYPIYTSFWDAPVILSFVTHCILVGFAGYLFYRSRSRDTELRLVAFGILWFYCFNAMESTILAFVTLPIYEYRVYMPSIGIFMAIVTGFMFLRKKIPSGKRQVALSTMLALIIVTFSVATYARNEVWRDEARFWEDNVKKSPGRVGAYANLGAVYYKQGRFAEGIQTLQTAISLKPNLPDTYVTLGEIYRAQGRYDEARKNMEFALTINPGLRAAHQSLGCLYDDIGRFDEAINEFKIAIRIDPSNAQTHDDLGVSYVRQNRRDEAEREFTAAFLIDHDHVDSHLHLGMLYDDEGKNVEAIIQLKGALRLNNEKAEAHYNLGLAYSHGKRYSEAIQEIRRAMELKPDYLEARRELEAIYSQQQAIKVN